MTVETSAGTFRRALDAPRGSPDQPLTDPELLQKFFSLATERLEPERARSLWDALRETETLASTDRLFADLGG